MLLAKIVCVQYNQMRDFERDVSYAYRFVSA